VCAVVVCGVVSVWCLFPPNCVCQLLRFWSGVCKLTPGLCAVLLGLQGNATVEKGWNWVGALAGNFFFPEKAQGFYKFPRGINPGGCPKKKFFFLAPESPGWPTRGDFLERGQPLSAGGASRLTPNHTSTHPTPRLKYRVFPPAKKKCGLHQMRCEGEFIPGRNKTK